MLCLFHPLQLDIASLHVVAHDDACAQDEDEREAVRCETHGDLRALMKKPVKLRAQTRECKKQTYDGIYHARVTPAQNAAGQFELVQVQNQNTIKNLLFATGISGHQRGHQETDVNYLVLLLPA